MGRDKKFGNGKKECLGKDNSVQLGTGNNFFVLFAIWMSTLHTGSLRYASRNFRTHSMRFDFLLFFAIYYYVMLNDDKLWQAQKELI